MFSIQSCRQFQGVSHDSTPTFFTVCARQQQHQHHARINSTKKKAPYCAQAKPLHFTSVSPPRSSVRLSHQSGEERRGGGSRVKLLVVTAPSFLPLFPPPATAAAACSNSQFHGKQEQSELELLFRQRDPIKFYVVILKVKNTSCFLPSPKSVKLKLPFKDLPASLLPSKCAKVAAAEGEKGTLDSTTLPLS